MLVARPLAAPIRATATCASTDAVGHLVYASGDFGNDGSYTVTKADTAQFVKMPVIGVIITKLSPTRAVIQFDGEIANTYAGLVTGRIYFVGDDGYPALVPPTPAPAGRAYVQSIGVAVDPGVLRLNLVKTMITRIG